jgi:hypothetical protein
LVYMIYQSPEKVSALYQMVIKQERV